MRLGDMHFSCGRAGTRRWVVCLPCRRVRDWTSERRMAFLGLAEWTAGGRAERRRRDAWKSEGSCMLDVLCKVELLMRLFVNDGGVAEDGSSFSRKSLRHHQSSTGKVARV